jgi:hypothetical protein
MTLKADAKRRLRLPWVKPGQQYAVERAGENRFVLVLMKKSDRAEPFPPGSLKKFVTKARNRELLEIFKGCSLEIPD